MQRSLNQPVRLTVETVVTEHPAGTLADHWFWMITTEGGTVVQQQTVEPTVEVALPPGFYVASVQLENVESQPIGGRAEVSFEVTDPNVMIQTAGSINVETL